MAFWKNLLQLVCQIDFRPFWIKSFRAILWWAIQTLLHKSGEQMKGVVAMWFSILGPLITIKYHKLIMRSQTTEVVFLSRFSSVQKSPHPKNTVPAVVIVITVDPYHLLQLFRNEVLNIRCAYAQIEEQCAVDPTFKWKHVEECGRMWKQCSLVGSQPWLPPDVLSVIAGPYTFYCMHVMSRNEVDKACYCTT